MTTLASKNSGMFLCVCEVCHKHRNYCQCEVEK